MTQRRKVMCLCQTYYQLIVCVQMRKTVLKDDEVTLVLTDSSNNMEVIAGRIEAENIFDRVFFAAGTREKTQEFSAAKNKLYRFFQYFFPGKLTSFLPKDHYDLLLTYNLNWYTFMLFTALCRYNSDIGVCQFEEGLISYSVDPRAFDMPYFGKIWRIKRLLKQQIIFDRIDRFYCFFPELYHGQFTAVQIPKIQSEDAGMRDLYIRLFDIDQQKVVYRQKYVYFASMIDSELDGSSNGELELVRRIADIVGKENLLVKMHPRENQPSRFIDLGIAVDTNSNIPFEILQLVHDFSANVFITAMSGAVINMAPVLTDMPQIYFLHRLLGAQTATIRRNGDMFEKLINQLNQILKDDKIAVVTDDKDLQRKLQRGR